MDAFKNVLGGNKQGAQPNANVAGAGTAGQTDDYGDKGKSSRLIPLPLPLSDNALHSPLAK